MGDVYEFRIAGRLSAELLDTFEADRVEEARGCTTFVRRVRDQGELFGVIARCETLGLRLVGFGPVGAEGAGPRRGRVAG